MINVVFAAAPAGLLAGSSLGGIAADAWGLERFCLAAGVLTLAAVATLQRVPPERSVEVAVANATPDNNFKQLFLIGIPAAAGLLLLSLPAGFMTPYLREELGLSLSGTGITNAQLAVGQLAWSALFAFWPGESGQLEINLGPVRGLRLRRGTVIAIGVCLVANAAFGALFPAGSVGLVILALLLRGAQFSLQPLGMALVSESTGTGGGLATRFSLLALLMGLATAGAPVIAGALYQQAPVLPFYVAGAAGALGVVTLVGLMALARRTAR